MHVFSEGIPRIPQVIMSNDMVFQSSLVNGRSVRLKRMFCLQALHHTFMLFKASIHDHEMLSSFRILDNLRSGSCDLVLLAIAQW